MSRRQKTMYYATLFVFACLLQIQAGNLAHGQTPPSGTQTQQTIDSTAAGLQSAQPVGQSKITTFWELYQHGGYIGYIIMGVLVLGVFIMVGKTIELMIDYRNAKNLIKMPFRDLEQIKGALGKSKESYLKGMMQHLITFFDAGYSAANTQYELNVFKHGKYEKFESYQGWLHFLSDSAGALGLLGTVWGVFQTFFGGDLDNEKILDGMGMALITTLFGLIVSLIINFGNTKLFSSFNKRMEMVAEKGDKMRLFLMDWESMKRPLRSRPAVVGAEQPAGPDLEHLIENIGKSISHSIEQSMHGSTGSPAVAPATSEHFSLQTIDGPPEEMATGESINRALTLAVIDHNHIPVQKARVVIETRGELFVDKNKRELERQTDKNGQIVLALTGGAQVGAAAIECHLQTDSSVSAHFAIDIVAGRADRIAIEHGNHQSARTGQPVPESLQVSVHDQFGNPVHGADVLYKLLEGEGAFNGGHPDYVTSTDADGLATAEFRLGSTPGLHRVQAALKGSKGRPVEFVLFSTP
ncbi:MAG: MotA/TolQ/ExbB proton channel family protein [Deferribacteres bacterium]|nr:MotA/TolQ/ExbB proton channel family protein [Deferribacteres bacterium]